MIRDTSAQDQTLSTPGTAAPWKRWLWPGIAALVVLLAIVFAARAWLGSSRSFDSARVRIAEVKQGDLVRDLAADGRVIAANSPILYAISAGTVDLKVVAGDVVKKGQELAVIDSPELRSKLAQERTTLAGLEAEASRAVLDATLARAKASKETDQASIERQAAERDLQRYQRGYDGGAVPQIDLAKANDSLKKADISLANAQTDARLQGQGADLDARNKRLLADRQRAVVEEVQRQVDALTLRAPFDGQVGQVQATQHTQVAANAPILGVVDLSRFEIEIKVPESFARDLSIGIPAQLTSGNGQPFPGEISAVSPEVVAGEVNARIRFTDKQPQGLRQSQRMQSRIVLDTRRNVIKVERGPFVEQGNGQAYVMDGDTAIRRPVRLGVSSLGEVEILSGLRPGDRVVVSGAELFGDAESVSIN
ncbi:efflux transporter periplasmic adaptor subunit [Stenotrophomonas rhizophila]|jgi:HlyD family secretion protein|uniref:HlyD family secretion protein n=1 Tax=Stenotrophomonas rhizophila TaxID=216778 RepID=A0AAP5AFK4_9GAMM|nr:MULTISPECIES: efflux RND transporter periplasmic adaptor subunit [Stenotrophomonas]AOA73681.1 ABC transporter permease [Stenotrophomonas rhizophila]MDQ1107336.1 HlyD family secretion protein [Stenotrophomonas rhizophila]MDY0979924.1 efflux RND transporter periplasmic adaptor subunit [Stenotrophomonas sp. CFBP8994]PAK93305.1 efflux transporter periplasmic adaptor subunit [Stenotrophomonas rhizophila]UQY87172.1 efflux RND transporter periplasmic adaptor subunit [Stenotrophomonas rhizophila]